MISNIEKGFINLLNLCVLQLAISMASSSDEGVSTTVYLAILKGLERLLLTDVLTSQDAEIIVKLSVDRWVYTTYKPYIWRTQCVSL